MVCSDGHTVKPPQRQYRQHGGVINNNCQTNMVEETLNLKLSVIRIWRYQVAQNEGGRVK